MVGLLIATHAVAQNKTIPPSPVHPQTQQLKASRASAHPYSNVAFTGVVTPHFQGNDLQKIAEGLSTLYGRPKGEFETTAQYNDRLLKAEASPLVGGMSRDSSLAFVFPTDDGAKSMWARIDLLKPEYDADKGVMKVSVKIEETHEGFHHRERHSLSIGWYKKSAPTDHYAASNAFGARTEVTAFTSKLYGIAFPVAMTWNGQSTLTMGAMDYPLSVSFPMESIKAQLLSKRLRVLVICTITTAPHVPVSNASDYHSATFDSPTSSDESYLYLHVRPTELWVFDSETGEVFAKSKDAFPTAYEF